MAMDYPLDGCQADPGAGKFASWREVAGRCRIVCRHSAMSKPGRRRGRSRPFGRPLLGIPNSILADDFFMVNFQALPSRFSSTTCSRRGSPLADDVLLDDAFDAALRMIRLQVRHDALLPSHSGPPSHGASRCG